MIYIDTRLPTVPEVKRSLATEHQELQLHNFKSKWQFNSFFCNFSLLIFFQTFHRLHTRLQ